MLKHTATLAVLLINRPQCSLLLQPWALAPADSGPRSPQGREGRRKGRAQGLAPGDLGAQAYVGCGVSGEAQKGQARKPYLRACLGRA